MSDVTAVRSAVRGARVPREIADLENALTSAFHAFDAIEEMDFAHRVRVVDEISGIVPEAAAAAARAGYGDSAERVLLAAAGCPPAWASICQRWDDMLAESADIVLTTPSPLDLGELLRA